MRIGIVGGGTFGSIIGRALQDAGCRVRIFDCKRSKAASVVSGFLMKPSWFDGLGKNIYDPALEFLDKTYGLQKISFRTGPLKTFAYYVERDDVIKDPSLPYIDKKVDMVPDAKTLIFRSGQAEEFDHIVIAAGIWSSRLVGVPELEGKMGIAFEWYGAIKHSIIRPWAPYKQVVAFNVPYKDRVWAGDGSAILEKNWTTEREVECRERVLKHLKDPSGDPIKFDPCLIRCGVGIRPYVPGAKPCLLEKRNKTLWIATGGAKNGTIGAAWAATEMIRKLS